MKDGSHLHNILFDSLFDIELHQYFCLFVPSVYLRKLQLYKLHFVRLLANLRQFTIKLVSCFINWKDNEN